MNRQEQKSKVQKYKYSVPYFFDTWFAFYNTICYFIFVGILPAKS